MEDAVSTRSWVLRGWGGGVLGFLYLPIIILLLFSFNASPMAVQWDGWTFEWYRRLLHNEDLWLAAWN
ncbi:MAG: spermidine/putrescine ABC transporter permease PotC, partial [Nitrospirae bacterium]